MQVGRGEDRREGAWRSREGRCGLSQLCPRGTHARGTGHGGGASGQTVHAEGVGDAAACRNGRSTNALVIFVTSATSRSRAARAEPAEEPAGPSRQSRLPSLPSGWAPALVSGRVCLRPCLVRASAPQRAIRKLAVTCDSLTVPIQKVSRGRPGIRFSRAHGSSGGRGSGMSGRAPVT